MNSVFSAFLCVLQHQAVLRPHHLFLQIYSAALEMDKNQSEVVGKDFKWSLKVVFTYMLEDSDDGEQKCEKVNGEYHSGVFLLLINVIKWENAPTLITSTQFQPLGNSPLLSEIRNIYYCEDFSGSFHQN